MEEFTLNAVQLLTSYGALGVISIYFMVKDWSLNKSIEDSLQKLTLAINLLVGKCVDTNNE